MEKITSRDLSRDSLGFANALKILKIAINNAEIQYEYIFWNDMTYGIFLCLENNRQLIIPFFVFLH